MLNLTKSTTNGEDCYTKQKTHKLNMYVWVCVCTMWMYECGSQWRQGRFCCCGWSSWWVVHIFVFCFEDPSSSSSSYISNWLGDKSKNFGRELWWFYNEKEQNMHEDIFCVQSKKKRYFFCDKIVHIIHTLIHVVGILMDLSKGDPSEGLEIEERIQKIDSLSSKR